MRFLAAIFGDEKNAYDDLAQEAATLSLEFLNEPNQTSNPATFTELMAFIKHGLAVSLVANDIRFDAKKLV